MKRYFILCLSIMGVQLSAVDVLAPKTRSMPIEIVGLGDDTPNVRNMCQTVRDDLAFTGQFDAHTSFSPKISSKKDVKFYQSRSPLLLTLADDTKKGIVEWRIYNTRTGKQLVGKQTQKRGNNSSWWGHAVADRALTELTGNQGFFSTQLVYCKEDPSCKNRTQICTSDFNGKNELVLVDVQNIALAPRWNGSSINPAILYSEYTDSNVRLMATDFKGNRYVATSFDGLNMLPAFSRDGTQAVICLSVEGSTQLYRYCYNKGKKRPEYIRLTHNEGNNISPTVLDDEKVAFCSDFEGGRPQIYIMEKNGKQVQRISEGGCCTSPAYCSAKKKIAYTKLINSVSQIMLYDLATGKTEQVTTDPAHKEEPSWSPCGNYLVFSISDAATKRLAVQNLLTHKRRHITGSTHRYSYPCWSPRYSMPPNAIRG